ncbi:hypothetical protein AXF42_Ash001243 [Apostasia shenzhenica]|uniref:AMP-activated protein kinase glycogen-binding domain-containing protein n=1 Tax=Apostasia shenzhenica TaxID=1088818 RepID=A0A2I0AUD0_9ASPA|nr:hypothetical protein AXF42_Ash001243 [Apostasia shenzhenica]
MLTCSLYLGATRLRFPNYTTLNPLRKCNFNGVTCSVLHMGWESSASRSFTALVSLNEEPSSPGEHVGNDNIVSEVAEKILPQNLGIDELKSLLLDSERSKLLTKLSEANQYNRFLKRQLLAKDDALANIKNDLTVIELELQFLISLAEEVANSGVQLGSRKINGKYIQSYLLSRLQAVHETVKGNMKHVELLKSKEVTLFWIGMAESVQVMGSFDGWSQGEAMSQEYSGDYARFSATIKLRPGRYEIKFLVDGEWQLSPELLTVGEGMLKNNLLIV